MMPEYALVAQGWKQQGIQQKLYFAELDYKRGQEVYQKLKITSVPLLLRFGPTTETTDHYEMYDVNQMYMLLKIGESRQRILQIMSTSKKECRLPYLGQ
jgi:hypothetical protein